MLIELNTGATRPARREDYATKAGAAISPGGDCTRWKSFLTEITGGEVDLQNYLQRVAGYCLTGLTTEEVLFFLYGTGANGKSVFLDTLVGIWGDYAVVAPMETFVETASDRHPTELAHLRGARLVVAQETEQGRHWAEAKIKALTGGSKITARYMRQDFFEFTPQFKLLFAGNHKPSLRGVDEAIRRRFQLIPFAVTIPPEKRDKDLRETLRTEWGGILQWAVEGCLEWQRIGLVPPRCVTDATKEYLAEEDSFSRWIDEACVVDARLFGDGARLWGSWCGWNEANRERVGTRKAFAEEMKARGFEPGKERHVRGYAGIELRGYIREEGTQRGAASDRENPPF